MSLEKSRLYLLALCGVLLIASVICIENNDIQQDAPLNQPNENEHSSGNEVMHWPWPSRKFKCPQAFGAYPDPTNCAYFYICVAKFATRTRCPLMYQFCTVKRVCLPMLIAVCDDGSDKEKTTTQKETQFVCPEEKGKFPYPHDCSKYYSCKNDQATLETCPDSELFDGVKGKCKSAEKVHCGSRLRPTDATPFLDTTQENFTPTPEETPTPEKETPTPEQETPTPEQETPTPEQETRTPEQETPTPDEETPTPEEETPTPEQETPTPEQETPTPEQETPTPEQETPTPEQETPTPKEETPTPVEDTPTPQEDTTTPKPRVTAPDTECDVDDLDCIIDDLGLTPDWFVCPDDLGSYPHPTSTKLFIFCLNWKPLVKKCGQDLVFSEDHMTCVSP